MRSESTSSVLTLARNDLACFCVASWPQFELAAHHGIIVNKLEAVERGELRRLMLFLPPRHGKSTLATQLFAAWYLGRHPDRFVISASYGQELADDFGRKVRNLLSDPLHQTIFPACRLAEDSNSLRRFNTTAGGSYYAVGRGGPITGRGAHLLIIDDPIKGPEEAQSEAIRHGLHEWYSSVAYTRLRAAIVLMQTRWHQHDLAGWLLREHSEEGWEVVSFPAIAERDEGFRREGEPLWPERFPLPVLEQIRQAIGGVTWASLYQQRPAAAEGTMFKRDWWQRYAVAPQLSRIIQSWDTAFKSGRENDYSVCTTWGHAVAGYFLLGLWRGRVEFPELKRRLVDLAKEWNANGVLVEDAASGQSLIQELRMTALPILAIKADSDKLSRAAAVTPLLEAGKVFLPESAPWLADYLDELAAFPTGAHDDAVDSTTQALNHLRLNSGGAGIHFVGQPRRWPGPELPGRFHEPFISENLFTKIL
jgi:predicted phage terminase large subunit-like protein